MSRDRNTGRGRAPLWPVIAAAVAPPAIGVVVLLSGVVGQDSSPSTEGDLWVGEGTFGPVSSADPEDIQVAHESLHAIGAECLRTDPNPDVIDSSVNAIVDFARRFPVGRFPIDDETATGETLLLVTRSAVTTCAPWAVSTIDAELPGDMRLDR
ncbi:MAG: hypothetical protein DI534_00190 [Leifsonia xyli]|nr:MAG: hypothetical protein DI534_00190 [Leifsonia xyli]